MSKRPPSEELISSYKKNLNDIKELEKLIDESRKQIESANQNIKTIEKFIELFENEFPEHVTKDRIKQKSSENTDGNWGEKIISVLEDEGEPMTMNQIVDGVSKKFELVMPKPTIARRINSQVFYMTNTKKIKKFRNNENAPYLYSLEV